MALKPKLYIYSIFTILVIITILLIEGTFTGSGEKHQYINSNQISNKVEIYRNEYGIPLIECKTFSDYFFSLGYMRANDRLLQFELQRRIAKGELSLFLNIDYFAFDKFMRDINIPAIADVIYEKLDPKSKEYLTKFVDGINSYLDQNKNYLPLEFGITNHNIEKFTIKDIIILEELYNLQKNNVLREKVFVYMSLINLGKTKTYKLLDELGINFDKRELELVLKRKYTYGDLKYLYDIYGFLDKISLQQSNNLEPVYAIKNDKSYLFSFSNISKTFLNYGSYCISAKINGENYISIYDIGRIIPSITRRENDFVFCELRNDYDSYNLDYYVINEKKSNYQNFDNSNELKLKNSIDTVFSAKSQKLFYTYNVDNIKKIIKFDNSNRKFAISISPRIISNNWFNYYFSNIVDGMEIEYKGNTKSYLLYKNDSLFRFDLSNSSNDTFNLTYDISTLLHRKTNKTYFPENFISYPTFPNEIYDRLSKFIEDNHNFNLTDLKLINNDNKNIFAEKYLDTILKEIRVGKYSKRKNAIIYKLKQWDHLDNIESINSINFNKIVDNFLIEYINEKYNSQTSELIFSIPEYKKRLVINLLNRLSLEKDLKDILIKSFTKTKFNIKEYQETYLSHILTYFTDKEINSLNLQNLQGGFSSIKYYYKYKNNNILNNTLLFFDISKNSNSLMMNFGSSSDLNSKWNTNLFELWKTGGTIESDFNSKENQLIIEITNEN